MGSLKDAMDKMKLGVLNGSFAPPKQALSEMHREYLRAATQYNSNALSQWVGTSTNATIATDYTYILNYDNYARVMEPQVVSQKPKCAPKQSSNLDWLERRIEEIRVASGLRAA